MAISKVILITGASSGIGAAAARLFAQKGYAVVAAARRLERLEQLASQVRSSAGSVTIVQADLANLADIRNLAQRAISAHGQVDILFNNAGFGRMDWLESLDPEVDVHDQIQVNLVGLIQLTQAILPHMIDRRCGHIINMASVAAWIAPPTYTVYAASKFAVRGFSEALRREVSGYGIKVSTICPGGTETEFAARAHAHRRIQQTTPSFLRLSAETVAQAVFKLAQHPRTDLILPWPMHLAVGLNHWLPGLVDWVIQSRFSR
jgi:hypothetical protein